MSEFGLLLPFDTDDEQFSRGFEAGRVWDLVGTAIVNEELPTDPVTVHAANAEMMLRIAETHGVTVTSTDLDDTWMEVVFDAR